MQINRGSMIDQGNKLITQQVLNIVAIMSSRNLEVESTK